MEITKSEYQAEKKRHISNLDESRKKCLAECEKTSDINNELINLLKKHYPEMTPEEAILNLPENNKIIENMNWDEIIIYINILKKNDAKKIQKK